MDDRAFVGRLMRALPEAFAEEGEDEFFLGDEPVRPECADASRRYWEFVEAEARDARDLANLLQIECFEGVGWVENLIEYVGPETRARSCETLKSGWRSTTARSVGGPRGA